MNACLSVPPAASVNPTEAATHAAGPAAHATSCKIARPMLDRTIDRTARAKARPMALKALPIALNRLEKKYPDGSVNDSGLFRT